MTLTSEPQQLVHGNGMPLRGDRILPSVRTPVRGAA